LETAWEKRKKINYLRHVFSVFGRIDGICVGLSVCEFCFFFSTYLDFYHRKLFIYIMLPVWKNPPEIWVLIEYVVSVGEQLRLRWIFLLDLELLSRGSFLIRSG